MFIDRLQPKSQRRQLKSRKAIQSNRRFRARRAIMEKLEDRRLLAATPITPIHDVSLNGNDHLERVIVVWNDHVEHSRAITESHVRDWGGRLAHVFEHTVHGFAAELSSEALHLLRDDPQVKRIEADLPMEAFYQLLPTGVDRIQADLNSTAKIDGSDDFLDVDIAIIDSGIDSDHPDLNVVGGFNSILGTSTGWDDDNGHGTHVAGIAAAVDNGIGVVGVAPGARLWAVKVLDSNANGYVSDIIKGIDWVTENANTIEVANMSLGGLGVSQTYHDAIKASVKAGVVYVAASGNSYRDIIGRDFEFGTSDDTIPAVYPEVAAISAIADTDGQPGGFGSNTNYGGYADDTYADFSNYSNDEGPASGYQSWYDDNNYVTSPGLGIDLMMPGVDIYSTYNDGGYAVGSGTSMAAPHAAGLAALYIAQNGRATDASGVYAIRQAMIDDAKAWTSPEGLQLPDPPTPNPDSPDNHIEKLGWAEDYEPFPRFIISPTAGLITSESGQTATFDVVLDTEPTADVSFSLSSSDETEGTVSHSSLTFTPINWNVLQTVTVTGVDDVGVDGDISYTIDTSPATSDDPDYDELNPPNVSVVNLDVEPILFADSFENGQWNSKWVEDSQNDWFTSTQRESDGNYSAEVDGWASNATLTMAQSVDMTPYGSAELSFDWYIESGFDAGEYLALDFSANGSTWTEMARLDGNLSTENTWHNESIAVDPDYLTAEYKIRFRANVSNSREDANVDNVQLVATSLAAPPNEAPVADGQTVETAEDISLSITLTGSDADQDPLTFQVISQPQHGTLTGTAPHLTYTPDVDYNGPDAFTFKANDGTDDSAIATVSITATPVNDAPRADNQSVSVKESTAKAITLTASDVDGDAVTFTIISGPSSGVLSGSAPNLIYTPDIDFTGSTSFSFRVNDGNVDSNVAIVSISVAANQTPVADELSVSTTEDTAKAITLTGSDPDSDPITFVVQIDPQHGTLSGSAPDLTYTPDINYNGSDSFTFTVSDGTDVSELTTALIDVTPINDVPVADSQLMTTDEDTAVEIILTGSDIEGDPLTYSIVSGPASGSLTGIAPDLTYVPNADFNGSDSFTFKVNDGSDDSPTSVVSITVTPINDAPVALGQSVTTTQDTSLAILLAGSDIDGDALNFTVATEPLHGVLSGSGPNLTYTPETSYIGPDSFTFVSNDGTQDSALATVTIDVTPIASGPKLSYGVVSGVSSNGWTTVTLSRTYTDMVVIATPNYDSGDAAGVTRIQNATGYSFDVRVDAAGGAPLSGIDVHYVVVEAGVYEEAGYKMEAVKFNSTRTDQNNSWVAESRSYLQSYSNPVVIGQVMSYNDSDWSVFWACGSRRSTAPTSSVLKVGKHVGEDSDTTRADETIGYLVIETSTTGTAEIDGMKYVAALGGDSIQGVSNSPAYNYSYSAMSNSQTAVASQAAMDGNNGGWAILYGDDPITATGSTLKLAIDEDLAYDTERKHTTEQVAYFIIAPPVEPLQTSHVAMGVLHDGVVALIDELPVMSWLDTIPSEAIPSHMRLHRDGFVTAFKARLTTNHLNHQTTGVAKTPAAMDPQALDQRWALDDEDENDVWLDEELLDILLS
ncbi:Subtilisin E precursor [Planctomycetes bacterium CA13]|uniref:Subtilisin E n=1 Tax=Novipirellula herctigrandis TaxID=2527986 RepID=A0A5C5Z872_9BACT|nr:Subtilisin E precursor [Planctomycetes bacterium CA13]